jgi:hypothetical protein
MEETIEEEVTGIEGLEVLDSQFILMFPPGVEPVVSSWVLQLDWARDSSTPARETSLPASKYPWYSCASSCIHATRSS